MSDDLLEHISHKILHTGLTNILVSFWYFKSQFPLKKAFLKENSNVPHPRTNQWDLLIALS